MSETKRGLILNNSTLISIGLFCFYVVVARNGDLSGKATENIILYGGCLLIALLGSRLKYKYVSSNRFVWAITLIPLLYSSPSWFDATMFSIGIVLIIFLEYRTSDLNKLFMAIILVGIINAICVFIQAVDKSFFDAFAKTWYPDAMYQQYLRTMRNESYLNGCNPVAGDTTGYLIFCIGLLFSSYMIPQYTKNQKVSRVVFAICIIAMILTGKRGSLICALAAVILLYIISGRASKRFQRFLLVVLLILVLMRSITFVAELFPSANAIVRVSNSINGLLYGQDITSGRTRLYGYALIQFRSHPLLGIGWKKFNLLTTTFYNYNEGHYVNNDYLQVLCETGIVGVICIYLPMIVFLIKTLSMHSEVVKSNVNRNIKLAFIFSLFIQIFHLTYSIFEIPLYDRCFFFTYILAVSMGYCAQKEYLQVKQIAGVGSN